MVCGERRRPGAVALGEAGRREGWEAGWLMRGLLRQHPVGETGRREGRPVMNDECLQRRVRSERPAVEGFAWQ